MYARIKQVETYIFAYLLLLPIFFNAFIFEVSWVEKIEIGAAEIVVRAIPQLIPERYIKILNPQRSPCPGY